MTLPFNSCTSIKVIGDPVDGIRYNQSKYDFNLKRLISLELKSDESIDTVDVDGKSPTIKKQELGFDLMSLTSARGHFVDKVSKGFRNNIAWASDQFAHTGFGRIVMRWRRITTCPPGFKKLLTPLFSI